MLQGQNRRKKMRTPNTAAALCTLLAGSAAWADHAPQQMTFYTQAVSTGASLDIIGGRNGCSYMVKNAQNGSVIAQGTVAALTDVNVGVTNAVPLQIITTDVCY